MKPMQFEGKWVLVTGASSGLGHEMAKVLAHKHKANLVLVARRADRLAALAESLQKDAQVQVKVIAADLGREDEAHRMFQEATQAAPIYGVILNAGVTHFGHYHELPWKSFREMVHLNVLSTALLTAHFLPYLEERKEQGGILLISSMAGLSPLPYQAAYSATKAFLANLGTSLHHEMWPRGVSVTTFAPGGIVTEMTAGERFNGLRGWLMPVDVCARSAVEGFQRREYLHVPGFLYRVGAWLQKLVPQKFFMGRVAAVYRKSLVAHGKPAPQGGGEATAAKS